MQNSFFESRALVLKSACIFETRAFAIHSANNFVESMDNQM